ncbi:hypothetical protein [Paraburkholderia phytofirmans]|nr:hypothetical protein [Paraburkholderia phytofirmans]
MRIRNYNKDNLREKALPVAAVVVPPELFESGESDPLRFWTRHAHPQYMDLTVFRDGEAHAPTGRGGTTWLGPFTGRPQLIAELAPAIRELCEYAAPSTASQYRYSLRAWWRLFDAVESSALQPDSVRVETFADVTELHRQRAYDEGMSRTVFSAFTKLLNLVRKSRGVARLYWDPPEDSPPVRHLPPQWQIDQIRFHFKRNWFAALARWERAEQLLAGEPPLNVIEEGLLKNYQRFDAAVTRTGSPRPSAEEIWGEMIPSTFNNRGYSIPQMLDGRYPNAYDIRVAFHLCLASTGWNPSTLLALDVDTNFIEPHPKDPTRYLMTGYKARSKSEQATEGLRKSRGSAGGIIQELIARTEPLRRQLRKDIEQLRNRYAELATSGAAHEELSAIRRQLVRLEQGVKSPWIYLTSTRDAIVWLEQNKATHSRGLRGGRNSFLEDVVEEINAKQPADRQLSKLKAGDFRDAFAAYAYRISGGMVLYVMKVLGHKHPTTTQIYLDNTLLNSESDRLYRSFSNSLWHEIRVHGRVDPTIVAKWSRDGTVTDSERARLSEYRSLRRSRIGVGCKDPMHPPKHIAPSFEADGTAMCNVQRCTLCLDHAVIFPDSLSGLCKRLAELYQIRSGMSAVAFLESSFGEEINNTEAALKHFDKDLVQASLALWQTRIASGEHRVVAFESI